MKRLPLVLLSLAIVGGTSAQAGTSKQSPGALTTRFTQIDAFLPPTEACPEGSVTVTGTVQGTGLPAAADVCLLSTNSFGPGMNVIQSITTIRIAGVGELRSLVAIVEVFTFPVASRTITGRIIEGTGAFARSSGVVAGSGTVTFTPFPVPDLTFSFDFSAPATAAPLLTTVKLRGAREAPGRGDPDGFGTALLLLDPRTDALCWQIFTTDIGPAFASDISLVSRGRPGPVVVPLSPVPELRPNFGRAYGCTIHDTAVDAILADSHAYYVNVHTAAFPSGAISGRLHPSHDGDNGDDFA